MAITSENAVCAYPWQQMNIDLTGEVVPCCFWSGYGNSGKPLGNTNEQSLEEIWNGEAYRELRRANASGDLQPGHPCHECLAWKWSGGHYPSFSWTASFRPEEGHCWTTAIPGSFRAEVEGRDAPVELHEDGVALPHGDAVHDEIRQQGLGRYSVWGDTLYLSTSDNSSPRLNGRTYELVCGEVRRPLASGLQPNSDSGRNLIQAHEEYSAGAETMAAKPSLISFIATSDCNIDCPSCSQNLVRLLRVQHRGETELEILDLVPYLTQLIWHGGEPYLIQHFREFIDRFQPEDNPNLTFGFTSNGTLLNEEELDKLAKFPFVNASISIDSFVEDTFHVIRAGARYDNVVRNTLRAVERYDDPFFVMSVGMIINKLNLAELPANLRFAMDHGIGLNLSPVVVVPIHDRLDIFRDFAAQTAGWREALDEADRIIAAAREQGAQALQRVDPQGMISALRDILDAAATRYAETVPATVVLDDPHGSLPAMRQPGLIVFRSDRPELPLTYAEVDGPGEVALQLPAGDVAAATRLWVSLVHDLGDSLGHVVRGDLVDAQGLVLGTEGEGQLPAAPLHLSVPRFTALHRETRNARVANRGLPTPDGYQVLDVAHMGERYRQVVEAEQAAGRGLQDETPPEPPAEQAQAQLG